MGILKLDISLLHIMNTIAKPHFGGLRRYDLQQRDLVTYTYKSIMEHNKCFMIPNEVKFGTFSSKHLLYKNKKYFAELHSDYVQEMIISDKKIKKLFIFIKLL